MALVIATRAPGVELDTGRFLAVGDPAVNVDTDDPHNAALLDAGLLLVEDAGVDPPLDPARFRTPANIIASVNQPTATIGNPVVWIEVDAEGGVVDIKTVVES